MTRIQLWNASLWSAYRGSFGRLRRVSFFEAAILDACQAQVTKQDAMSQNRSSRLPCEEPEESDEDKESDTKESDTNAEISDEEGSVFVGQALIWNGAFGDGLGKLARHEATLMNVPLLLQSNRQGERGSLVVEAVALPPKDR